MTILEVDVYKRQGEHQNQFPKLRSLRRDERGGGNHPLPVSRVLCEEARHLPQGPPVSYTHLDVYKRQQ